MLIAFGEPLLELRHEGGQIVTGLGGDALNVAARAAKAGLPSCLIAGEGRDLLGRWLADEIASLGVEQRRVAQGGATGIYAAAVTAHGQRSFSYWRDDSPMAGVDAGAVATHAAGASAVYLSGITQALSDACTGGTLALARAAPPEAWVLYDPNLRTELWAARGGTEAARKAAEELMPHIRLVVPSLEDCAELWGWGDAATAAAALSKRVQVALVKDGAHGVAVGMDGGADVVAAPSADVHDTTGAGDAFNGALLAALSRGDSVMTAARIAVQTASESTAYPGALSDLLGKGVGQSP